MLYAIYYDSGIQPMLSTIVTFSEIIREFCERSKEIIIF